MKTIYLIGFMGSGKSTVGSELAKKLKVSFIDIDHFIEQKYNKRISDIFKQSGENTFRLYEMQALQETMTYDVVATGGGIVERKQNIEVMKNGLMIYLETSFEEIARRLKHDKLRPLWKGSQKKQKTLFNQRRHLYEEVSDHTVQTTNKYIDKIVTEIASFVNE